MRRKHESPQQRFTVGQVVMWASQANGSWVIKTGEVTVVVPPGKAPGGGDFGIIGRDSESYLVKVTPVGKRGPRKPRIYWPLVSKLKLGRGKV